ncbi:helix-turn-helix transcriptional regulator [Pectobacterium versatile]|uniref:Helix-turn-helix domain-containing protein n=1 Tax=Pectobacterium versatile TaxID=2488639 RepID=A0A7V8PHC0_9GAMM|nr:helix-turn-helix transcriptional regulator [Pectobacterium versatile]MBA0165370.1 helix-turn-helix domain-containing protein [Pectobacterium versatile]MBN3059541.1 helix-turn-helix domain-containing protein [Pectobacterium versatile]POY48322.1 transcriptional regulator [Pectobacterium versatile]QPK14901.1 helix-turn-helix domain-containing protein [Pectobacterium versatile]
MSAHSFMSANSLSGPKALGAFLRALRERTTPEMVGLPASGRRRTSGLRREELAQIARISTTWYTWLEQGRDVSASASALLRVSQALKLEPAEHDYLFSLAGVKDPQKQNRAMSPDAQIAASLHHITCPAYLLDGSWNMLAWNAPSEQLFAGWLGNDPEPNLLRFMFLNPLAQSLVVNWPERAKRIVAEFRAESSHYAPTESVRHIVMSLCEESREFALWWLQQAVTAREGGERRFHHPLLGDIAYHQQTFHPAMQGEFKLVMLIAQ